MSGSMLPIEWTNQHGCGAENNKLDCDVVLQIMFDDSSNRIDSLRDGVNTDTQEFNPNQKRVRTDRGLQEPFEYYRTAFFTERNKGDF